MIDRKRMYEAIFVICYNPDKASQIIALVDIALDAQYSHGYEHGVKAAVDVLERQPNATKP